MDIPKKQLVAEALIDLHRRLSTLATRSHERRIDHAGDRQIWVLTQLWCNPEGV
jgi:hypothetical protein